MNRSGLCCTDVLLVKSAILRASFYIVFYYIRPISATWSRPLNMFHSSDAALLSNRWSAISIGPMMPRCTETSRWRLWRLNLWLNMWYAHSHWRGWVMFFSSHHGSVTVLCLMFPHHLQNIHFKKVTITKKTMKLLYMFKLMTKYGWACLVADSLWLMIILIYIQQHYEI